MQIVRARIPLLKRLIGILMNLVVSI